MCSSASEEYEVLDNAFPKYSVEVAMTDGVDLFSSNFDHIGEVCITRNGLLHTAFHSAAYTSLPFSLTACALSCISAPTVSIVRGKTWHLS